MSSVQVGRAVGTAAAFLLALWSHAVFAQDHAAIAREAMSRCSSFLMRENIRIKNNITVDIISFDRSAENGNVEVDTDNYSKIIVYGVAHKIGEPARIRTYINTGCVLTLGSDVVEYWLGDQTFERMFQPKQP